MLNVWKFFDSLLPKSPLLAGTVTAHGSNDTSYISYPGGGTGVVRGQTVAVGEKAFILAGQIQGAAPSLSYYEEEV